MMTVYAGPRANRTGEHRATSGVGQRTMRANLNRAGITGERQAQIMANAQGRVRSTRGMTNG